MQSSIHAMLPYAGKAAALSARQLNAPCVTVRQPNVVLCSATPSSNGKRAGVSASASILQTPSTTAHEATTIVVTSGSAQPLLQHPGDSGRANTRLTSRRFRVAVDVDEVLGRFVHALNEYRRDHHSMLYGVEDYHIYNFASVWKCTEDESSQIVHDFFKSRHFQDGIPVIPGSQESLRRLSEACDLVVVTSRQHVIREATLRWLDQHFPDLFLDVHFGNHYALQGPSKKKSEICREVGAQILIDDNPRYALECAEAGIYVLLFDWLDSYRWAKTDCGPSHPLITRVSSWTEVEQELDRLQGMQLL